MLNLLNVDHKIRFDLGNYCNLACPTCFRNTAASEHSYLNTHYVTIEEVQSWFPEKFLRNHVKEFIFNGASSEPTLNPHFMEIVDWFHDKVPILKVSTNTSTRNPDWWYELGKTKIHPVFAIDTLTPGNELYRINADTKRIRENIEAFAAAGGKGTIKLILFKHNQDEIPFFKDYAKKLGQNLSIRASYDMVGRSSYDVESKGKTYTLEKNTIEELQRNKPYREVFNTTKPVDYCQLTLDKTFIIHSNGIVYPCCHIEGEFFSFYSNYFAHGDPTPREREYNPRIYDDFISKVESGGGITKLSLKHHSIEEIVNSKFFKSLAFSWRMKNNETCMECKNWNAKVFDVSNS
tara:strand:+ start:334 stop:1380 length:1047 start_codon:yes stop_codon:yes gene_type:complete